MIGEAPANSFQNELAQSTHYGSELMASMIRASIFGEGGQMPPPEMFEWYVHNLTYRLVDAEHKLVYKLEGADQADFDDLQNEMKGVQLIMAKNKMFGLQAKVEGIMRIRALHLPH